MHKMHWRFTMLHFAFLDRNSSSLHKFRAAAYAQNAFMKHCGENGLYIDKAWHEIKII